MGHNWTRTNLPLYVHEEVLFCYPWTFSLSQDEHFLCLSPTFLEVHALALKASSESTVSILELSLYWGLAKLLWQFDAWFINVAVTPDLKHTLYFNQWTCFCLIDCEEWQWCILHKSHKWTAARLQLDYCTVKEEGWPIAIFHQANPYQSMLVRLNSTQNFRTCWPYFKVTYDCNMIKLIKSREMLVHMYTLKYSQIFNKDSRNEIKKPKLGNSALETFPNSYWEDNLTSRFLSLGKNLVNLLILHSEAINSENNCSYPKLWEYHQTIEECNSDQMYSQRSFSPIAPEFDERKEASSEAQPLTPLHYCSWTTSRGLCTPSLKSQWSSWHNRCSQSMMPRRSSSS